LVVLSLLALQFLLEPKPCHNFCHLRRNYKTVSATGKGGGKKNQENDRGGRKRKEGRREEKRRKEKRMGGNLGSFLGRIAIF
jgi:hypothetical protein